MFRIKKSIIAGIIAVVSILCAATAIDYLAGNDFTPMIDSNITIALPFADNIEKYDSLKLEYADEYNFVRALYSPLIEFNDDNEITGAIADKFYWEGSNLVFHIDQTRKTNQGNSITAYDAYISLKRLISKSTNTHGDLKYLLCGDLDEKIELEKKCSGLSFDEETNLLILKPRYKSPLLVSILTSIDFVIIPATSIDFKTLKIADYTNTSGPYFYSGKNKKGQITLRANPDHWHIRKNSPKTITIFSDKTNKETGRPDSYDLLLSGEVDHIPTASLWSGTTTKEIISTSKKLNTHKTQPINLTHFRWTVESMTRPANERLVISRFLQDEFHEKLVKKSYGKEVKPAFQFFPPGGHGSISASDIADEREKISKISLDLADIPEIKISASPFVIKRFKEIYSQSPFKIKYVSQSEKETSDLIFTGQDVSYEEDASLLSFALKVPVFNVNGASAKAWIDKFFSNESPGERVVMIQSLHRDSLFVNPSVIPLMLKPYYALSTPEWAMNFPTHWARSPYWQLEKRN